MSRADDGQSFYDADAIATLKAQIDVIRNCPRCPEGSADATVRLFRALKEHVEQRHAEKHTENCLTEWAYYLGDGPRGMGLRRDGCYCDMED